MTMLRISQTITWTGPRLDVVNEATTFLKRCMTFSLDTQ